MFDIWAVGICEARFQTGGGALQWVMLSIAWHKGRH